MKIELQDLSKSYADAGRTLTVLNNVSYSFPKSGKVAIVGRSGVGKSTLLHILGGLDRPTAGEVRYDGKNVATYTEDQLAAFRGRHIGFVFQFHHLLPEFSALENVAMPLVIRGEDRSGAHSAAQELLGRIGLGQRLDHRPGELSGGEQQRVAIARALISKPDVVLADEPTGNLDHATAAEVQALLFELQAELGNLLVVVTHSQELAHEMDFVAEMLPGGELKGH